MIIGIGIDFTTKSRFVRFLDKTEKQLSLCFSLVEIACLKNISEKEKVNFLSTSFAIKEALFKALPEPRPSFFQVGKATDTGRTAKGAPWCSVNWHLLYGEMKNWIIHVSLTHEKELVGAYVLIEERGDTFCGNHRKIEGTSSPVAQR